MAAVSGPARRGARVSGAASGGNPPHAPRRPAPPASPELAVPPWPSLASRPGGPVTSAGSALRRAPVIRSGAVPALADRFASRPESAPGLAGLVPGTVVALVSAAAGQPGQPAGRSSGKTQLAAHFRPGAGGFW
ncbi:MAG TPA: hypothetical protein VIV12_29200 [Streptosporangiaceae bacterium]